MPNHCSNSLRVWGERGDVARFVDAITKPTDDDGREFSILENLVPRPDDIGEGWYEWSVQNWGTKWGDYEGRFVSQGDDAVELQFTTAWSAPVDGMDKVTELFPKLNFVLTYWEPNMGFSGAVGWVNGSRTAESEQDWEQCDFFSYDCEADDWADVYYDAVDSLLESHRNDVLEYMGR